MEKARCPCSPAEGDVVKHIECKKSMLHPSFKVGRRGRGTDNSLTRWKKREVRGERERERERDR
jgi:hypothetical protein